jgi:hypothetical protein
MNNVTWVDRGNFLKAGIERIAEVDILLDIGCGIVPHSEYTTPYVYICCEPFHEYVEILKKKVEKTTDSLYIVLNYDWETVVNKFGEKSVDTVFLLDVIEHLDKKTGERLLKLTEKIARRQIVIFTPLGFVEQKKLHDGKDAWGLNGAEWQEHKSGWLPEDFDESWEIIACKDFHLNNNIGEKLDEPFGAFWAIKNISNSGSSLYTLLNQHDDLAPIFIEQGKRLFRIIKQENVELKQAKASFELENANLKQVRESLEQENTVLKQVRESLEQENTVLKQVRESLEQENTVLKQVRESLEQENTVLKQVRVNLEQEYANLKQEIESLEQENVILRKRYRLFEFVRKKLSI